MRELIEALDGHLTEAKAMGRYKAIETLRTYGDIPLARAYKDKSIRAAVAGILDRGGGTSLPFKLSDWKGKTVDQFLKARISKSEYAGGMGRALAPHEVARTEGVDPEYRQILILIDDRGTLKLRDDREEFRSGNQERDGIWVTRKQITALEKKRLVHVVQPRHGGGAWEIGLTKKGEKEIS